MPAVVSSTDGSYVAGTSDADGRRRWSRASKKDRNLSRSSSELRTGGMRLSLRPPPIASHRRARSEGREVRVALLGERPDPLGRLVRVGELRQPGERDLPEPAEMLGVGVERLLDEAQGRWREREHLVGPAAHLRTQLGARDDAVDQAPALGCRGVVAAARE